MQIVGDAVHPGRVLDDSVKQVGQWQEVTSSLDVAADGCCSAQSAAEHQTHGSQPNYTNWKNTKQITFDAENVSNFPKWLFCLCLHFKSSADYFLVLEFKVELSAFSFSEVHVLCSMVPAWFDVSAHPVGCRGAPVAERTAFFLRTAELHGTRHRSACLTLKQGGRGGRGGRGRPLLPYHI